MKRGIITINNGVVGISTAPVWMVQEEIAGFVRCSRFYIIGGIFFRDNHTWADEKLHSLQKNN